MSAKHYKTLAGLETEVKRRLSWTSSYYILTDQERQVVYVRSIYQVDIITSYVLESLFYPRMKHQIDVDVFYNDKFEKELRLTIRLEPFKV